MECIKIDNGFICVGRVNFKCPFCGKDYNDSNDKYLNRINKSKNSITKKKCSCGNYFGITYHYNGDIASFKLTKQGE